MKRTRRHHSPECKREAVALVVEHGYSCTAAGHSLGVSGVLIGRWKGEREDHETEAISGNGKRPTEQQRIHELESENGRLRMEREILKKATAFIANETTCRFIEEQQKAWPITLMCGVSGVSRSGLL
jgi:transposase